MAKADSIRTEAETPVDRAGLPARIPAGADPASGSSGAPAVLAVVAALLFLLAGTPAGAQSGGADVAGHPLHRTYTSADYGKHLPSQNWSVTQDADGIVYVANPGGILVYDGEHWRLVPTERRTLVRTVFRGRDGTIYAGGYDEIGHLAPDSVGTQRFVSLNRHLDADQRHFGHVWSGAATSDGAFFQARDVLLRWDGDALDRWPAEAGTHFDGVFAVRDTAYVARRGRPLLRVAGSRVEPVSGSARFADAVVTAVVGAGNGGLLVGTADGRLYQRRGNQFERFATEADRFLAANELTGAVRLSNGATVLATRWGGAAVVGPDGRLRRVIDERAGIVDDDVKGLFVDRQNGLWMACESGIARVDVAQPLSVYDDRTGIDGAGLSLARHGGRLHAGTSSGVFRLQRRVTTDGAVRPTFERVGRLRAQVFDLLSTEEGLLAATDRGVYRVSPEGAPAAVTARSALRLHRSRRDASVVYVGYTDGVGTLRRARDGWTAGPEVAPIGREAFFLAEDRRGALWAASAFGGLWRIPAPRSEGSPVDTLAREGEDPGHVYRLAMVGDEGLHVVGQTGLRRPVVDSAGKVRLVPDTTLAGMLPPGRGRILDVKSGPDGDRWVFTDRGQVYWVRPSQPGTDGDAASVRGAGPASGSAKVETPFAPMRDVRVYTAFAESGGRLWTTGEAGVLRHAPQGSAEARAPVATLVRRVTAPTAGRVLYGGSQSEQPERGTAGPAGDPVARFQADGASRQPAVGHEHSSVRFEFAAPRFEGQTETEYRVRLTGFDDTWGEWSTETFKEYTSLPPGDYRFEVEARSASVGAIRPAGFAFTVARPWFRTLWAYGLYAAVAIGAIGGLVRWRSVHLERRADRLERVVASRTAEVEVQARRLETVNEELVRTNDHLRKAIEEKSELLGVAAHDLKNPIFGIRALAEVMLERSGLDESGLDEKAQRKMDLIRQSADEALHLINDLLASAANSGRVRLEAKPIDLAALTEWVCHTFAVQADRKDQTLRHDVPDEPCMVEGDERKLREALNNLVSNAIKYSPHGAPIEVRVRPDGERYRFTVSDAGPGLSEEDQQRLFTPFQRLTPEPTGDEGSSGLGLYIVKQIVTLHDGTVGVESTLGEGSTFIIELPALPDTDADAGARPPGPDGLEGDVEEFEGESLDATGSDSSPAPGDA